MIKNFNVLSQAKCGIIHYGLGFFILSLMKPQIKFKLNKTLDKKMASEFLNFKQGGIDFAKDILNIHPELKILENLKNKKKREKIINIYFDKFYKKNNDYLKRRVVEFNADWKTIKDKFLNEVSKVFIKYPFPKGKYAGYLSIINCNPRFLKDKTFQIFYFHPRGGRYVTMHELLHFIFYDYAINKFPKIFSKLNTENDNFWDLAEIFNSIILSSPGFKKIHKQKNVSFYPKHKKHITKITALWKKTQNIDEWLLKSYEHLKIKN